MSKQQITHEYLIYNHGTYLGKLQNVTSPFNLNETINSAGAQLQITVGQSADIANLPISPILDENGNTITDENGTPILPERQSDIVGSGGNNILIQNDNDIYVYEYSKDNPTGVCVFQGYISKWKATFGKTDDIQITCLSNGQDLSSFLVLAPDLIQDQSQTSQNDYASGPYPNGYIGTQFTVGAGITTLAAITVHLSSSIGETVGLAVWNSKDDAKNGVAPLASTSLFVSTGAAKDYQFVLPSILSVTSGNQYFFGVTIQTSTLNIYIYDTKVYSGGSMYLLETTGSIIGPFTTQDIYFKTFYGTLDTTGGYTNTDVSTVFDDIMTNYNSLGGIMRIPSGGYALSGQLATYTFKSQTLLQGIQTCQAQLAPPDWWWYAEPSNSTVYFQESATTADFILIKGRHIDDIEIEATKEAIKNDVYFTGGATNPSGSYSGANVFVHKTDSSSILNNRRGLAVISDNRVSYSAFSSDTTAYETADLIAQNEINYNNAETYITTITLDNSTIDTTQLKIGKMIGFAGFGNFVDSLVLQIVGRNRNPLQTTLTVGTLPARVTKQIKDIQSALAYLQTVDNPSSAS